MDANKKKELINDYKEKKQTGGVYCIECTGNGRRWLYSTTDLQSAKNRFGFSVSINACPDPPMQKEFREYGIGAFSFNVLEELERGETQTATEFSDDIKTLYAIWLEKSAEGKHE